MLRAEYFLRFFYSSSKVQIEPRFKRGLEVNFVGDLNRLGSANTSSIHHCHLYLRVHGKQLTK